MVELSSNWKKLQAQIKAESSSEGKGKGKRKAEEGQSKGSHSAPNKRQKVLGKAIPQKKQSGELQRRPHGQTKAPSKPQMGNAQSIQVGSSTKSAISPSLALWAEDNGISAEDLAQAYGLGIKDASVIKTASDRPNEGLAPDIELGKYIAIDCEMVGVGENGYESALARVSVVDFHGRQIYDSFVRPKERVTDWRTHVSGVSPKHMATARSFEEVQTAIAELLDGRILVGHDVKHDLQVLMLNHPSKLLRDTARFSGFRKYGHGPKPALRILAKEILGVDIQSGQHSSIEDARVAMLLFRRFKSGFDMENANRFPDAAQHSAKSKSHRPKQSKKKGRK